MEWLMSTNWIIVFPVFLTGFVFHKLGRPNVAIGCWLFAIIVVLSSIGKIPDQIAHFNQYPEGRGIVWGQITLIMFTGILSFPVFRFLLAGTKLSQFLSCRR